MPQNSTVGENPKYVIQKYQNCQHHRIPLSRKDCILNFSPVNKFILKWQKRKYDEAKEEEKRRAKKKKSCELNLLPSYSITSPSWKTTRKEEESKTLSSDITPTTKETHPKKCIVNFMDLMPNATTTFKPCCSTTPKGIDSPQNGDGNRATHHITRISPEFYDILQRYDRKHGLDRKITEIKPEYGCAGTDLDRSNDLPDWAKLNPNLYNYLKNLMSSGAPWNKLYGIDFENNFDPEEIELFKSFHPAIAIEMLRALDLFKLLQSGATLTSEQLQFLAQFLRNFAHLGAEPFDFFMSKLNAAGLDNDQVGRYMQNLYMAIKHELGSNELSMVMQKLNIFIERAQSSDRFKKKILEPYLFQYDKKRGPSSNLSHEGYAKGDFRAATNQGSALRGETSAARGAQSSAKTVHSAVLGENKASPAKRPDAKEGETSAARSTYNAPGSQRRANDNIRNTFKPNFYVTGYKEEIDPWKDITAFEEEQVNVKEVEEKVKVVEEVEEEEDEQIPRESFETVGLQKIPKLRRRKKKDSAPEHRTFVEYIPKSWVRGREPIYYHPPWHTEIHWEEVPKFYRLSTGARRSTLY